MATPKEWDLLEFQQTAMEAIYMFMEQVEKEGYVLLKNMLTEEDLAPVIEVISRHVDEMAEKFYKEGHIPEKFEHLSFVERWAKICSIYYKNVFIWNTEVFSREVYDLIRNPKLLAVVEQILGPDIAANGDWWVRPKLPREDITTLPWHQDSFYYGGKDAWNPDFKLLSVWIPLVDVDHINGCLQVIPGSNHWGRIPCEMNELKQLVPSINVEEKGEVLTMQMNKGDILLFNQTTMHRSLPNHSDHIRWNIDLRYSPAGQALTWHRDPDLNLRFPNLVARSKTNPANETSWEDWHRRHLNRKI